MKGVERWPRFVDFFSIEFSKFFLLFLLFTFIYPCRFPPLYISLWESAFSFYLPIYSHYVTLIYSPFAKALDAKEPTLKSFHITHPHTIALSVFSRPPSSFSSHRTSSLIAIHLFIYLYNLAISFSHCAIHTQRIQYSQRLKKFLLLKRVFKLHLKLEHRHSRQNHLWTKNPKLYIIYTPYTIQCAIGHIDVGWAIRNYILFHGSMFVQTENSWTNEYFTWCVCVRACVRTFVSANDFAILQFARIEFCLVAQTIFIIFPFRYKNNRLAMKIVTTK